MKILLELFLYTNKFIDAKFPQKFIRFPLKISIAIAEFLSVQFCHAIAFKPVLHNADCMVLGGKINQDSRFTRLCKHLLVYFLSKSKVVKTPFSHSVKYTVSWVLVILHNCNFLRWCRD